MSSPPRGRGIKYLLLGTVENTGDLVHGKEVCCCDGGLVCCENTVCQVYAEVFEGVGEIGCFEGIDSFLPCAEVLRGDLSIVS